MAAETSSVAPSSSNSTITSMPSCMTVTVANLSHALDKMGSTQQNMYRTRLNVEVSTIPFFQLKTAPPRADATATLRNESPRITSERSSSITLPQYQMHHLPRLFVLIRIPQVVCIKKELNCQLIDRYWALSNHVSTDHDLIAYNSLDLTVRIKAMVQGSDWMIPKPCNPSPPNMVGSSGNISSILP